jgi:membrane protease YdiL (CAAX protease family)
MNHEMRSALLRVLPFALVLFFLILLIRRGKLNRKDLFLTPPPSLKLFFLWTGGFLLFSFLVEYALYRSHLLEIDKWHHPSLMVSVIRITGAVLLAPVVEEMIFRGLILNILVRKLGLHPAIFAQAVIFVLLHSFTYENTSSANIGIAQGFVDATLYGYARYNTRSLYTPIAMHITGNLFATVERFTSLAV